MGAQPESHTSNQDIQYRNSPRRETSSNDGRRPRRQTGDDLGWGSRIETGSDALRGLPWRREPLLAWSGAWDLL